MLILISYIEVISKEVRLRNPMYKNRQMYKIPPKVGMTVTKTNH